MQDKGYVPAQPDAYQTGLNQKDNSQRVYDPASGYWWYPSQATNPGAWEDLGYEKNFGPYQIAQLIAGAGLGGGIANAAGLFGSAAGAGGVGAGELSAIGPAQGSILGAGAQASGAMTYPVANFGAGLSGSALGAAGGVGASTMPEAGGFGWGAGGPEGASQLSSIGPAQGSMLEPGLQASGATTYPVADFGAGLSGTATDGWLSQLSRLYNSDAMKYGRAASNVGSLLTSGGQSDTMARAADQARIDEDQRQQRIAQASQKVNELFAPYGDDYYNKVSQDYEAYYAPELDRQYGQTKGKLIADLSSRGVLDSSIAGKEQGDLARLYADNQRTIKSQAQDYGRNWRNTVEGNRSNLLSLAESGAPLETVGNAFSNMEGFMTEPPEYSPLGDLFSQYSGNLTNAQLVREARQSGLGFASAPSMGQNYRKNYTTNVK